MKRDILAVIIFLATGFLFYLVQAEPPIKDTAGSVDNPVEAVSVQEDEAEVPGGLSRSSGSVRDS